MRPHGSGGLELETVTEALTAATALQHCAKLAIEQNADNGFSEGMKLLSGWLVNVSETYVISSDPEPFSILFDEKTANCVHTALRSAANTHPDSLFRQSVHEAMMDFELQAFAAEMGETPPNNN